MRTFGNCLAISEANSNIPSWYNALNLNHDNYEAFRPGDGVDHIDGRGGYDEISYTDSPAGMTIDLNQSTITDGWGKVDTFSNIEGVEGTDSDDTIIGNSEDNSLDGRLGNNDIDGGGGFDYIEYNGFGREMFNIFRKTVNSASEGATTIF